MTKITHLSALPEVFDPGEGVDISITVQNSGYLPLTGELTIEVQTSDGAATVATFNHTVTDLDPTNSQTFNDTWDTTGATEAEYRVVGYMSYEGRTSNIASIILTNFEGFFIFLPLISK